MRENSTSMISPALSSQQQFESRPAPNGWAGSRMRGGAPPASSAHEQCGAVRFISGWWLLREGYRRCLTLAAPFRETEVPRSEVCVLGERSPPRCPLRVLLRRLKPPGKEAPQQITFCLPSVFSLCCVETVRSALAANTSTSAPSMVRET